MKKRSIMLTAILCISLAAGCAKTPDEPIVRKKGSQGLENYKEAQIQENSEETETDTRENEDGAANGTIDETADGTADAAAGAGNRNALAVRLEVPEIYQSSIQSEDGLFQMDCDAQVHIPDVDKIGVYKVSQLPFDEKLIAQMTRGFFGDSPVYDGDKYFQVTKEQALKKLEELKGYQAAGNLDPYGYIAAYQESGDDDINPDEIYSLQRDIDIWEEAYQQAPEAAQKEEVIPGFRAGSGSDDPNIYNNFFDGAVEKDGGVYMYRLKRGAGNHMQIEVAKVDPVNTSNYNMWIDSYYDQYAESGNKDIPDKSKAESMAGITPEEAVEIADEYIKNLGLNDFSAKSVQLSLKSSNDTAQQTGMFTEAGYLVNYTRDIDGFPVTRELNLGGGVESMESTQEAWGYENVEFVINKDGLQYAQILNLYQIGEKQVENVDIKSFPEISGIFEQMLQIQNSNMKYADKSAYHIKDVTLGYMRIYDPGADSTSGILVPVWDFFGSRDVETTYEGETYNYTNGERYSSFLTVNAADGTVIDRDLGY